MVIEGMIGAAMNAFKQKLTDFCDGEAEGALSVESAHRITEGIQQALAAAGRGAFRVYLESKEELQDVVVIGGESFRFKYTSEKRFETLWGVMGVRRRVYQNASDTGSHVALDAAWGMAGSVHDD